MLRNFNSIQSSSAVLEDNEVVTKSAFVLDVTSSSSEELVKKQPNETEGTEEDEEEEELPPEVGEFSQYLNKS